jgi:hypothetical protein
VIWVVRRNQIKKASAIPREHRLMSGMSEVPLWGSTITGFEHGKSIVTLRLLRNPEHLEETTILVHGVTSMEIDGALSPTVSMGASDGEVIHIEMSDCEIVAIVEWNDFSRQGNSKHFTKSYRIIGKSIDLIVRKL